MLVNLPPPPTNTLVLSTRFTCIQIFIYAYTHTQPFIRSACLLLTEAVFVLQVFEHVGGVSSFRRHFLMTNFADGEAVTHHCPLCVFQVSEMLPDGGRDVLRGGVKVQGLLTALGSSGSDRLLNTERWDRYQHGQLQHTILPV